MCVAIEEACKTMLSPTLCLTIAKQSKRNMLTLQDMLSHSGLKLLQQMT